MASFRSVVLVASLIFLVFVAGCPKDGANPPRPAPPEQDEGNLGEFCGLSTYGSCETDADCVTGGCSGQVCQSRSEEPRATTCEWRECYDSRQFGLGCGCIKNQCQWGKGVKVAPTPVPPKLAACETLDEKACQTRADCKPVYGASRCECHPDGSQLCTADIVFKGCEAPEPDEVGIVRAYFHQQWFRVMDGCGTFNQEACRMEPDKIYSKGKTGEGYRVVVEPLCGGPMPEMETIEYVVGFDGVVSIK